MNRFILLGLHIISLILLGFGWTLDMLHIDINIEKHFIVDIHMNLFDENRSVFGTLESLWNSANYLPFFLIFFFGILIPLIKSGAIFYVILSKSAKPRWKYFISAISKWAMADVFVISIFIAFLGAKAMENTKANLESGFYFFAGYVYAERNCSSVAEKTNTVDS